MARSIFSMIRMSVDADPRIRREIKLLPRLHIIRGVPSIEVSHGVGAELSRRMDVGQQALTRRRLACLEPPALGKTEEELLIAGDTLDGRTFLPAIRHPVRFVSRAQA